MNRTLYLSLVLLAPIGVGTPTGDHPAYQPKAGTVLHKNFSLESDLELEDMTMEVNGQEAEMPGQVEVAMKITMKLGVTDEYQTVGEGRPDKLKRSYDEISSNTHVSGSNPMTGPEEKDIPLESELEGSTVVFSWDAGDSEYQVAFDGDAKGDEALLEKLEEDLDLRGFLPSGEVSKGDTWKIPADAVKAALAPGGDVKLRPDGDADPMGGMERFSQSDMIGELDGDFDAVYEGTRDEDGAKVAVIKLKIDAKSAQDMTDRLEQIKEQMKGNIPDEVQVDIQAMDGEFQLEAEGELLWNLEAGLVHGFNLSGEVRMIVDMSMSIKMGDQEQAMEISQTFSGNQTMTLTTGE